LPKDPDQDHKGSKDVPIIIRNPYKSAFFSFLGVGLGQFYNGETIKGLFFLLAFFIFPNLIQPYGVFIYAGIWIAAIADAFISARKINNAELAFHGKSIFFWIEICIVILLCAAVFFNILPGLQDVFPIKNPGSAGYVNTSDDLEKYPASHFETGGETRQYIYILRGLNRNLQFTVYKGVNDHLAEYNPNQLGATDDYYRELTSNPVNRKYLQGLINEIKKKTVSQDDRARIAFSLVQQLYYERNATLARDLRYNYPYETIYKDSGTCADKSIALAFLLKELGYGVALMTFVPEEHMVVGIKAPAEYSYKNTGYAFVDPVCNSIIPTYDKTPYGSNKILLASDPVIIKISDGISFDSISEEYADAQEWKRLERLNQSLTDADYYGSYQRLRQKYGMVQVYDKEVCVP
jgi:TM2 domain-containing membrane protein YozV